MALPAVDFNRLRMDASSRFVQNRLIWAQSRAIQKNMQLVVEMYYDRSQFRIVEDADASGTYTNGETAHWTTLPESMKFATPPTTIDGSTAYYATGAGITKNGAEEYPALIFYANGSSSGDAVIYLGSPRCATEDNRAIKVTGSTSKMSFYRMGANGTWGLSEL